MSSLPPQTEKPPLAVQDDGWLAVPSDRIEIGDVLRVVARQWWIVLLVLVVFVAAGLAYASLATKIYAADTRVLIDPRNKQIVGNDVTQPSQGVDVNWVETQVDLATSYTTLKKVVESEKLDQDPEFSDGKGDVLQSFAQHVRASRPADTYVIDIAVSSVSAEKAARLSMAVAQAFIETLTEAKQNAARQANQLLLKQIDDLRSRAEDADRKVQDYRQQHNVVEIDGKPVDEQTLKQLNEANVAARLRADQAADRAGRIDSMIRSGAGDFGNALDTIDSPVIQRLRIEYALDQKQQAELAQTLGPRHPKMAALEADLARTRALILQELKSLADRARIDADLAKAQAAGTAASLAIATKQVTDTSEASVVLRQLQAEASIRQDVYRTFVARAQETGLQENLQVADARIINPAQIPLIPDSPKKKIIVGLAGIAGLGIGLSLAIYRGRSRYLSRRPPQGDEPEPPKGTRPKSAGPKVTPPAEATPRPEAAAASGEYSVPAALARGEVSGAAALALLAGHGADAALQKIGERLLDPSRVEGPAVLLLFGAAQGGAIASFAFALSQSFAAEGAATLLVDASTASVTLTTLLAGDAPGVLDLRDPARPETVAIARRVGEPPIVLMPASSAALRPQLAGAAESLATAVRDRADGFDQIVIDLGPDAPPELFAAFADMADDALMVIDAAEAGSPQVALMAAEFARLMPGFRGTVAVREIEAAAAPRRSLFRRAA